ncbi:recombinase family protein [Ensifer sp. 2TAB8]|uniref:recombinase family protein n=1 Tax=Ensifer sp. 2TAB8 TaxID=3233006 RepID=UPI003F90F477
MAAQYVRMSTELQKYSTDNQKDAIRLFAEEAGYEIVATYEDAGRSGLNIEGRIGLQRLLADVEGGRAEFDVVLVYDVSRWGRFQNIDESASYEFRCHVAGVRVEYCAEQFVNDGSIGSDVLKAIKRSMAAEHSRVLSVKVFAGQYRLIGMGYRQGGPAGFGLRRLLIDQNGQPKTLLARNEHKSLQTDRVILVPGPDEEVRIVRSIYHDFVMNSRSEDEIARVLNARGIETDLGRQWTRGTVHQILINEKYIGNNVWNRASFKLKRQRVRNEASHWARANGAFEAIVDREQFESARAIIAARSARLTDEEMLAALAGLLKKVGSLSGIIIDEAADCPSSSAFSARFGSLLRAYKLISYTPERDYRYIEINRRLRAMHPDVILDTTARITERGAVVSPKGNGLLLVNGEFSVSIVIVRCHSTSAGSLRWHVGLERGLDPDITIAVRMNPDNMTVRDYFILPTSEIDGGKVRTAEANGIMLDAFLFDDLEPFFALAERCPIKEVA